MLPECYYFFSEMLGSEILGSDSFTITFSKYFLLTVNLYLLIFPSLLSLQYSLNNFIDGVVDFIVVSLR